MNLCFRRMTQIRRSRRIIPLPAQWFLSLNQAERVDEIRKIALVCIIASYTFVTFAFPTSSPNTGFTNQLHLL